MDAMSRRLQCQLQFDNLIASMYKEQILDDQFKQLWSLADESNPNFVTEVVTLFFEDSEKLLENLTRAIRQPVLDFKQLGNHVHQLKGSSSSIGANRIKKACVNFRDYCEGGNRDGCLTCLRDLQQEYILLKQKLEYLFEVVEEIVKNGGTIPPLD